MGNLILVVSYDSGSITLLYIARLVTGIGAARCISRRYIAGAAWCITACAWSNMNDDLLPFASVMGGELFCKPDVYELALYLVRSRLRLPCAHLKLMGTCLGCRLREEEPENFGRQPLPRAAVDSEHPRTSPYAALTMGAGVRCICG